ncbi:hypothetical protein [Micromonospora sp. U21]|uniref:hypothetical protein n=1 Tax=Micromonospora sp. U21 TaxID=2824899 RepID=UPI001B39BADD|nr:hypothetical protein [Micromonospora sp. U21]MBQ0901500.1 hypothetical protein [Micromonospora sp. U21]
MAGMRECTRWPAGTGGCCAGVRATAGEGALAGWLVFGWASRRTEGRRVSGTASFLFGMTMVLWWLPVLLAAPHLLQHHLGEPHPAWHPLWEWLGQPTASLLFLVGALCALLALGLAAAPHRDRSPVALVD